MEGHLTTKEWQEIVERIGEINARWLVSKFIVLSRVNNLTERDDPEDEYELSFLTKIQAAQEAPVPQYWREAINTWFKKLGVSGVIRRYINNGLTNIKNIPETTRKDLHPREWLNRPNFAVYAIETMGLNPTGKTISVLLDLKERITEDMYKELDDYFT